MLSHLAAALLAVTRAQAYDTVFDQLKNMAPRPERVATVHAAIVLRRDVIELRLDSGMVYLLTPVAGRTVGIAFVGAGSVSFVPPLAVEQFNLKRASIHLAALPKSILINPLGSVLAEVKTEEWRP